MRIPVAIPLLVLAGCLFARPGPHTANHLALESGWLSNVRIEALPSCPVSWNLHVTLQMPTPGWKVVADKVERLDDARLVVYLTGTGPEGPVIQVITPTEYTVRVPTLRKGRYVVELRYRAGAGAKYERRAAFVAVAQ